MDPPKVSAEDGDLSPASVTPLVDKDCEQRLQPRRLTSSKSSDDKRFSSNMGLFTEQLRRCVLLYYAAIE